MRVVVAVVAAEMKTKRVRRDGITLLLLLLYWIS